MAQEILLKLISEGLYIWFILTLAVYFINWYIMFKLSFLIVGEKTTLKRIFPAILIMITFVCVRPFIPINFYLILLLLLMIASLYIFGKLDIFKSIYSAIIVFFISFIGNVAIEFVLLSSNPKLVSFFFNSVIGNIVGAIIEVVFPLVGIFIFSKFSLRLPLKDKSDPYDFIDMVMLWLFGCMFYLTSFTSVTIYSAFIKEAQNVSSALIFAWIASAGIIGGVILILKVMKEWYRLLKERLELERKKRQEDKQRHEEEQRMNQEKMQKLEAQHQRLNEMYEQLQNTKERPQKVVDSLSNAMSALKEYYDSLTIQNESGIVFENEDLAKITLSDTESSIIELIIQGKTDKEIAKIVHLSTGRVSNIIAELLSRTGLNNRTMLAVRYALFKFSNK